MKSQMDVLPFIKNALLPNVNVFAPGDHGRPVQRVRHGLCGRRPLQIPAKWPSASPSPFPSRNRQAQADEVRSRLEMQQAQDTLVRSKSQVEVDVQNALIAVRHAEAQVEAAEYRLA